MNRHNPPQGSHPAVIKQQYDSHNVWHFENQWETGICACKPCGRCCFSCFCLCCMGCMLSKRLGEVAIVGCCPCTLCYLRGKLRTARRIDGSCCGDFCASDFCAPCVATQMAYELENQGLWDDEPPKKNRQPRNDRYN